MGKERLIGHIPPGQLVHVSLGGLEVASNLTSSYAVRSAIKSSYMFSSSPSLGYFDFTGFRSACSADLSAEDKPLIGKALWDAGPSSIAPMHRSSSNSSTGGRACGKEACVLDDPVPV